MLLAVRQRAVTVGADKGRLGKIEPLQSTARAVESKMRGALKAARSVATEFCWRRLDGGSRQQRSRAVRWRR
jgi:hypothetical protein